MTAINDAIERVKVLDRQIEKAEDERDEAARVLNQAAQKLCAAWKLFRRAGQVCSYSATGLGRYQKGEYTPRMDAVPCVEFRVSNGYDPGDDFTVNLQQAELESDVAEAERLHKIQMLEGQISRNRMTIAQNESMISDAELELAELK